MLELLHIENIAVIEKADIQFHAGFNALTGETGAGKSIVIDAMGAVLGGRTSRELIRTGAAYAFVSAEFSGVAAELTSLTENGIMPDEDGTLLLQREIYGDGKNICRVNGRPVTVAQLRRIGSELVNIHGQRDSQQLMDEESHRIYLDHFGKITLATYQQCYRATTELESKIQSLKIDEAERARRIDNLQFQINELESANLVLGEEEELLSRRNLLHNAEKYLTALANADYLLNGDDERVGAVSQIQEAERAIEPIGTLNDDLKELSRRLETARCEIYDIAETIRDSRAIFDFSPAELDKVESRCEQLYRLEKKYGATVSDMMAYLEKCRMELESIEMADDTINRLEEELKQARQDLHASAHALTKERKKAAVKLERQILKELRELDMKKVQFSIAFIQKEPSIDGCDIIRFLMSANAGEALKPIAKIASGGELARIMLALKNVLVEQEGTLVFDEVDTGVSGRAAQRIAEKLAQVSRRKQTLCVTHLPQIAAMADTQFSVEKEERNGRTYTKVILLTQEARKGELARLIGGETLTDALLKTAGELLTNAETFRSSLVTE